MRKITIFAFLLTLLSFGCKTSQQLFEEPIIETTVTEFRDLDTMMVSAKKPSALKAPEDYRLPVYKPSYRLKNDLIHTKLELKFDWEKERVIGKAELTLKPWFYPTDELELDAKNFDINNVTLATGEALSFDYDGKKLYIQLNNEYDKTEHYKIVIDYVAKPSEGEIGGSAAITSDKGLFFINADGKDPNKPQQIWTQGETENNSRWFPTIDKPNERTTQEMYLTVQDKYKTLSNGVLVSSTKNMDGTRTDYWKMEQPHAPYLFMVAVGDFAKVEDSWQGIPVNYYVEREYEADAKNIFAHTPEMLSFFSEKLGLMYMWPKYSQIVVRDYVSGAMENTTAVVFGQQVQKKTRELIDNHNDYIVAHELFHHWFGDYVTCESWANLTMNEGFANYSEYLWFEHKYGREEADYHRINELNGYLGSVAGGGIHPLIWFDNPDKEAMFDGHSYNKGGMVLHMLRQYVGDDAFFASLKKYLQDNAYTAVEAHDLRLAFEEVTGQDLNWFFNQWYFEAGHPELVIDYGYDAATQTASVTIEQTQDPEKSPAIFQLPILIDIHEDENTVRREEVFMDLRKQTFYFKVATKPALINVDAEKVLLAERQDNKTEAEYVFQYHNVNNLMDRYEALQNLKEVKSSAAVEVRKAALRDKHWFIRNMSLEAIEPDAETLEEIAKLAVSDIRSQVRANALDVLSNADYVGLESIAGKVLDNEQAYPVIGSALMALNQVNPVEAVKRAEQLEKDLKINALILAVGDIYAAQARADKIPFFEKNLTKVDGPEASNFFHNYAGLLLSNGGDMTGAFGNLKGIATDMSQSLWRRFFSTQTLAELSQFYSEMIGQATDETVKTMFQNNIDTIQQYIAEIKKTETNQQLIAVYTNF
ncbi:MAG: M1 family aminopeptidase [Bacteroidota bacterium]